MTHNAAPTADFPMNIHSPQKRPLPRWAQFGVLLLVFAAGGIVGAMTATKSIHSRMEYYRENPDALPAIIGAKLQQRLKLTDQQFERVGELISLRHPKIVEHQRQGAQAMLNEFKLLEDEVADVLDSDQKRTWRELTSFVRERFLPKAPSSDQIGDTNSSAHAPD